MEFKIGDKIRCLPGFNNDGDWKSDKSGGGGYLSGGIYTIERIIENKGYNRVFWLKEDPLRGVFSQAVVLYNDNSYEIY